MFGSSFLSSLPNDDDASRQRQRPTTASTLSHASSGVGGTSSTSLPFSGFAPVPPPSSSFSSSASSKSNKRSNSSSSSSSSTSTSTSFRNNDNAASSSLRGFGPGGATTSSIAIVAGGSGHLGTTTPFGGFPLPSPASALWGGNASSSSSSSSLAISLPGDGSSRPSPASTTTNALVTTGGYHEDYGIASPSFPTHSVECSCASTDGRSFHTYHENIMGGDDAQERRRRRHVVVSEFAPFEGHDAPDRDGRNDVLSSSSALKITTVIPTEISDSIDIDPVIGLICVDDGGTTNNDLRRRGVRGMRNGGNDGRASSGGGGGTNTTTMSVLPWMCLYTSKSAYVISIGFYHDDDMNDGDSRRCIDGRILRVIEPFERHMLSSPRGSSILRIRPAPTFATSSSYSAFHRTGSMAVLLREGGTGDDDDECVGYAIVLYHGLPGSAGGGGGGGGDRDHDGRSNPSTEGSVTTPLRFDDEDLVRGLEDTVEAENEAYETSSLRRRDGRHTATSMSSSTTIGRVVDFCFMSPSSPSSVSGGFSSSSILVLTDDGSVYGASPIIFDGTVLPRDVVIDTTSRLDAEIEASESFLRAASSSSPAPTFEQECVEARLRQCRAARRYLLDVFGLPDLAPSHEGGSRHAHAGSYYVSASVVHTRSYSSMEYGRRSQALAWQTRLQGPLILSRQSDHPPSDRPSTIPPYVCIESFGGATGGGIIDGFVVARHCGTHHPQSPTPPSLSPIHVEFGILPGEGAALLPRFEFESDVDCRLIDDLVRGTGMYVERATITQDRSDLLVGDESGKTPPPSMGLVVRGASVGRDCSIVLDPLDDSMIHVINRSHIVTVTTNAVAMTAKCFTSRVDESNRLGDMERMPSIRTKVWSCLEVNTSGSTALIGARVSGDVHLGHVLYARLSDGSMEVVNITETHCLHEISEQMKAKSEQSRASQIDDEALEALKSVQPLHNLLQPLFDKVCDGLSKMGKIVGGATLPKDAGPENLAVFLETQHSCEVNVLMPMEEISKVLNARRDLLQEMHDHQAAELVRLSELLVASKQTYVSNLERVLQLEASASILAQRSSAVLTATRDLRPQITDAEKAYFKDLQRYETSCSKWEGTADQLRRDATSSCDAMSAGAIENGDVHCIVDLRPEKVELCHNLLKGEGQLLKKLEREVKESNDALKQLSKAISGLPIDSTRHKLQ